MRELLLENGNKEVLEKIQVEFWIIFDTECSLDCIDVDCVGERSSFDYGWGISIDTAWSLQQSLVW